MRLLFLGLQSILFLGGFTTASAQNNPRLPLQPAERHTSYYRRQTAEVSPGQQYSVQPAFPFTGLSVRIPRDATFSGAFVVVRQDTIFLQADEHTPPEVPYRVANLMVFDQPVEQFAFYSATLRGSISFSLINATGEKKSSNPALRSHRAHRTKAACEEPDFVPQEAWRQGLPAPSYTRRATTVEHIIVHHSATFNNLTNYENVVRNIYLFHTRDREWSDIGYNYLIAQDGTIFEGRSAGSQNVDNDNVQGAHFCGKNGGTMGICLLGNFNTAEPTDTALASLERLIAWKVDKEGLDPLGERTHPANARLRTIAGHRDGCATACPGDNLYPLLPAISVAVAARVATGCGTVAETSDSLLVFPVPTSGTLSVRIPDTVQVTNVRMYDLAGKQWSVAVSPVSEREFTLSTHSLATGLYVLHLWGVGYDARRKVLVQ